MTAIKGKLAIRIQRESLELLLRHGTPDRLKAAKITSNLAQAELLHERLGHALKSLRFLEDNEAAIKAAMGGKDEAQSPT